MPEFSLPLSFCLYDLVIHFFHRPKSAIRIGINCTPRNSFQFTGSLQLTLPNN